MAASCCKALWESDYFPASIVKADKGEGTWECVGLVSQESAVDNHKTICGKMYQTELTGSVASWDEHKFVGGRGAVFGGKQEGQCGWIRVRGEK